MREGTRSKSACCGDAPEEGLNAHDAWTPGVPVPELKQVVSGADPTKDSKEKYHVHRAFVPAHVHTTMSSMIHPAMIPMLTPIPMIHDFEPFTSLDSRGDT